MKNLDALTKAIAEENAQNATPTPTPTPNADDIVEKVAQRVVEILSQRTTTPDADDEPSGVNDETTETETTTEGGADIGNGET